MKMKQHIQPRDFDVAPASYAKYLKGQIQWARTIASNPAQQWPAGNSHDIARAVELEAETAYIDLVMEHGVFHLDGTVEFQDEQ
jgi:hypothetical protein